MNEVFDSEHINVEYRKDDNIVLVVLKGTAIRDHFRTPMMHAADMVMRHSCKVMAVDVGADIELGENDATWCKKVLLANLKKSGLETLVLIDSCGLPVVKKCAEFCEDRLDVKVCKNYDEARELTGAAKAEKTSEDAAAPDVTDKPESKVSKMTREEALDYMGLSHEADIKEIDDRFWQMSKLYRGKDDHESMAMEDEIAEVYDIASGRRDARLKEEKRKESEPKYFGRYKSDWQNIIQYNWRNWLLAAVVTVSAIIVIVSVLNNTKSDCAIVLFGHMQFDNTYLKDTLVENNLLRPYVGAADIVVPNDEDQVGDQYMNTLFDAMLYTEPCVLISDEESYPYYFYVFKDLSPIEDQIMNGLTEKAKAGIEPVYMSEQDNARYQNILIEDNYADDSDLLDPSDYPDTPILIGFRITDPQLTSKLGVDCYWQDRETTLVLGQYKNSNDPDLTAKVITVILNAAFE